jgi:hypothetical protein
MTLNGWEDGGLGALLVLILGAIYEWLQSRKAKQATSSNQPMPPKSPSVR